MWWRRLVRPLRLWWIHRQLTAKTRRIESALARPATLVSVGAVLKDRYPAPGNRIKQYVVDERNERAWDVTTCPRIVLPRHRDDEGEPCPVIVAPWCDADDNDDCSMCRLLAQRAAHRPEVAAWRALKFQRPPICADRDTLSDEIAPDLSLAYHPTFRLARGEQR